MTTTLYAIIRRCFLTGIALILCALPIHAQIEWLATEYDFGSFPEAGGPRSGEVQFINHGNKATVINNVRLTCGCTSEAHTEGLIAPGDTARVRFTYNPAGRPGRFEKSIKVYTGEHNELTTIKMKGTVIGTPQTLSKEYPFEEGPLRFNTRSLNFEKVRYGTSRHQFIVVYNQSHNPLHPIWKKNSDALDVDISVPVIPPGELATFSVYFNTRELGEMGPVEYKLEIIPDENIPDSVFTIPVRADIQPDTEHLTAQQIADGPRTEVKPRLIDLGILNLSNIKNAENYPLQFLIFNEGKSILNVTRIYSKGAAMRIKRYPATLKAGKNGKVEATVDLRNFPTGPFNFKIEVMSDDPIHPVVQISVCGEIESSNTK